jgi:hypothetical protein
MKNDLVINPCVKHRNVCRPEFANKSYVAEPGLIEKAVHRFAVVDGAFGYSLNGVLFRFFESHVYSAVIVEW